MDGNVTVDQAISRAKWLIKTPMFFILLASIIVKSIYFNDIYGETIDIFITIFIALGLCWLYWSFTVPIWKIWAYTNVRNVHELKLKAQKNGFIFKDGNFFEKTEIKSYEQRETLKKLEKKFLIDDVYHDDFAVPKETKIYYSKTKLSFTLFFVSSCFIGLLYLILNHNLFKNMDSGSFSIIFLVGLLLFLGYSNLKKILNSNPQIIISEEGIQIKVNPMISWKNINNEIAYGTWKGKYYRKCFAFNDQEIIINDYTISVKELEELLHTYRARYDKNNPS